ncbi:restriction endonuclease [Sideroxydans lithotrophicus]|uniref:Restriction endonuclease n=1 Tax=Sideroxydans lithotrophicus (strain ES-1) TaxID=580332 RepID=D5CMI6_SIDLE|nr:restriction endonuclease [Sideroxydans lithotrophicus]ADE12658.1 restriction endonuclease [Sideroxydans lithotrophicus ES-1]
MARKRQQGTFEDLIDIAAMLPWWAGVFIALISYFVLHHYATAEIVQPTSVAQLGANVSSQLGKMLATFGQYLIPLASIIGAGVSAFGRHKRNALLAVVQKGSSVSILDDMSWQEFEMLVGEAFRRGGYTVTETGGGGADGGVDLVLHKDSEKFLVQCKQWKAFKVGVTTIRELYGVMAAGGATGGFVVTSGVFTQEAKAFAEGRNIDLIDGAELKEIIREVRPSTFPPEVTPHVTTAASAVQSCPNCGSPMVRRIAKQGANTGKAFWGCSNYPQCRGIVAID